MIITDRSNQPKYSRNEEIIQKKGQKPHSKQAKFDYLRQKITQLALAVFRFFSAICLYVYRSITPTPTKLHTVTHSGSPPKAPSPGVHPSPTGADGNEKGSTEFENLSLNRMTPKQLDQKFREVFKVEQTVNLSQTRMNLDYTSETNNQRSTAVYFFPSDPGIAKDHSTKTFFALNESRVRRLLQKAQTHNVIVRTVNSIAEMNTVLENAENITYMEIGAHGSSSDIKIGSEPDGIIDADSIKLIDFSHLAQGATLLLSVCETGGGLLSDVNIACSISKTKTLASKQVVVVAPITEIKGEYVKRIAKLPLQPDPNKHGLSNEYLPVFIRLVRGKNQNVTRRYCGGVLMETLDLKLTVNKDNYNNLNFMSLKLQERYFQYLERIGYEAMEADKITLKIWKKQHGKESIKISCEQNEISREKILRMTLQAFYQSERLENQICFDVPNSF